MRAILPLLLFVGIVGSLSLAAAPNKLPAFKAERWVNSAPLTAELLRGKVVLVDVWEYTCINWIRTLPYIQAWNREYASHGLVVVGVHSPEFEFGKRAENIDLGILDHGLTYPIAIDNEFTIWRALGSDAWPAKYLFDGRESWSSVGWARGSTTKSNPSSGGSLHLPLLAFSCPPSARKQRYSRGPASRLTPASPTRPISALSNARLGPSPLRATDEANGSISSSGKARARSCCRSLPAR